MGVSLVTRGAALSSKNAIRSPARLPALGDDERPKPGSVAERECGEGDPATFADRLRVSGVGLAGLDTEKACDVGREDRFSVRSEMVLRIGGRSRVETC
jgi:hypothetical protein